MAHVIQLDEHITNLISAGEVVERASSVVKELVENAIDAGANHIEVLLQDSGVKEIIVRDDGCGMDIQDAKMAILPHCTSKIQNGDDLFRIQTLGFRGEALPSIIAVSDFRMKTSTNGIDGFILSLKGGKLVSEMVAPLPKGTEIKVKNLFFNTPARLQNLSSLPTELAWCTDVVAKAAMAHPTIAFSLVNNDRDVFTTFGDGRLDDVIGQVYGLDVEKGMIDCQGQSNAFKIKGFISQNALTRSNRNYICLFVNNRPFRSAKLFSAIMNGYGTRLMQGRYPIVIMNIETDASLVDVNVHPSKLEVRFSDEEELVHLMESSIQTTLASYNMIPVANMGIAESENDWLEEMPHLEEAKVEVSTDDAAKLVATESERSFEGFEKEEAETVALTDLEEEDREETKETDQEVFTQVSLLDPQETPQIIQDTDHHIEEFQEPTHPVLPELTYIGQYLGTYILAQNNEDLYIIDQHAAMERINYEKVCVELSKTHPSHYELLVPLKVNFSVNEAQRVNACLEPLKELGIIMSESSATEFEITQIPLWISKGREQEVVEEMIDAVINNRHTDPLTFQRSLAKSIACKASIKGNTWLSEASVDYILTNLTHCQNPYCCPHGRPTIVKFTKLEMDKLFKRTVED